MRAFVVFSALFVLAAARPDVSHLSKSKLPPLKLVRRQDSSASAYGSSASGASAQGADAANSNPYSAGQFVTASPTINIAGSSGQLAPQAQSAAPSAAAQDQAALLQQQQFAVPQQFAGFPGGAQFAAGGQFPGAAQFYNLGGFGGFGGLGYAGYPGFAGFAAGPYGGFGGYPTLAPTLAPGFAGAGGAALGSEPSIAPSLAQEFSQFSGSPGYANDNIVDDSEEPDPYPRGDQPPIVTKSFYVHSAPEEPEQNLEPRFVTVGRKQVNYKVVFIKAPTYTLGGQTIPIQAPTEEKTVIYVLSKKPQFKHKITLPPSEPTQPTKPDVFFIKYKTQAEAIAAAEQIKAAYERGDVVDGNPESLGGQVVSSNVGLGQAIDENTLNGLTANGENQIIVGTPPPPAATSGATLGSN